MKKITLFFSLLAMMIVGLQAQAADDVYTICGSSAALFGKAWDPAYTANDMTLQEDGSYQLLKENVTLTLGDIQYKVTDGHAWGGFELPSDGGNQILKITSAGIYNVTFTLNSDKNELTAVAQLVEDQPEDPIEIVYTIVGDASLLGANWDTNAAANEMVKQEDGTYKLVKNNVTLADGKYSYKVVGNHDYGVFEYPMGMNNNTISIDKSGEYNVTFTLKLEGPELSAEVELIKEEVIEHNYTVTGVATLMGSDWNTNDEANLMALQEDGTYKLVKEGVQLAAGGYDYKVVRDHSWDWSIPQGNVNQTLTIAEDGKYNVTFTLTLGEDAANSTFTAIAEKVEDVVITHTYTVAGVEALMGSEWSATDSSNDMTLQEDGTYKLVKENVELLIKDYEYKVVVDHAWVESYPAQNAKVSINKAGKYNVTFTFDAESHEVNALVELVEPTDITSYTVVGDEALMGANWDVTTDAGNDMTKQEDGTYTLVKNEVELEAKEYKYKVVGNHDYSVFQLPLSGDQILAIAEAGKYNVTFTLTLGEENVLTAEVVKIEEPQPETKYLLHYGTTGEGAVWQDAEFVKGEDGKFAAANIEFAANTQFGVKYGDIWYAGLPNAGEGLYWIHDTWCTDIPLSTGDGVKNFIINEAGTYTFVLTVGENGITMDVEGFPVAPVLGDLNGDGKADVTDVNIIVNMILGKQAKTEAGNLNGDDDVDVTDVNLLVNIILGKSGDTTGEGE